MANADLSQVGKSEVPGSVLPGRLVYFLIKAWYRS